MVDPRQLADIEAIKQLKARYFRLLDGKQWQAWGELFSEGCEMRVEVGGDAPDQRAAGREEIVSQVSRALQGSVTVHHGHMPEIEITGEGTARGVWAMFDWVAWGTERELRGYGHYHETYEKRDGRWRIASLHLTRLRVDFRNGTS